MVKEAAAKGVSGYEAICSLVRCWMSLLGVLQDDEGFEDELKVFTEGVVDAQDSVLDGDDVRIKAGS